ncbi:hypothetical protein DPEC_G00271020 [Dallia pectoralis]|uniref:Uncharacterized protein n=1 Tax=Dallia pectoralis TaxID=75939 RepID=A0ACC2FPU5_DALPE|nr:hypothetical protein DPEC_G00271020 [Dallia pectoralis]
MEITGALRNTDVRFSVFNDAYKRDFQKRSHKFHLYDLFLGLGEGEHSGDPLHNYSLTNTPEQRLRVAVGGLSGYHFQTQIVRQKVVPGLSETGEGAVQGSLHPGRLAGGQEGAEAHRVSYLRQDVARLRVQVLYSLFVDDDVNGDPRDGVTVDMCDYRRRGGVHDGEAEVPLD